MSTKSLTYHTNCLIFKGKQGSRAVFKSAKYKETNPKVVTLTAAKSIGSATKSAFTFSKATSIAFVFVCGMDVVEWLRAPEGERFFSDLVVDLASETIQWFASALAGSLISAMAVAALSAAAFTSFPVVLVVGLGLVVSIAAGLFMTYYDDRLAITEKTQKWVRERKDETGALFNELIAAPVNHFLYRLESEIYGLYERGY